MQLTFLRQRPQLVVAIGVLFSSFSANLIRLSDAPALAIATYRLLFSVALLAPLSIMGTLRGASGAVADDTHAVSAGKASAERRRSILLSVASGAFLALHFGFWITSLEYTSVASSTVLVSTHPILVALVSAAVLGERVTPKGVIFMLCALAGSALLVAGGMGSDGSQSLGNLLAFLGAVSVTGYIIIGRIVRQRMSLNAYTLIVYSAATVVLAAGALAFSVPFGPYPAREFLIFLALAFFCTLLGHSLFSWALRYVRPTVISTSALGEPVAASIGAFFLFMEVPTLFTLIGGAVILVSIYFFVRSESRPRSATASSPRATGSP